METNMIKGRADNAIQVVIGLVEVLKEYGVKPDNFCITGSYALATLGLHLDREPNDVDLYLILDPEIPSYEDAAKRLAAIAFTSGYPIPYKDTKTISLDFQGIRVNVFIIFNTSFGFRTIHTLYGYHLDTIDHILSKKMALKRPKDYKDLNTIIKNLLSL